MSQQPRIKKITNNLMLIALLFFAINQYFIGQALGSVNVTASNGSKIQLRDNAAKGEVIQAILPRDADTVRPYKWQGQPVTLSARVSGNGYDMLVSMNKVQLTSADERGRYDNLTKNIYHPCCDSPISNCGCKHAVAAKGLIKYLLTKGYTDDQIEDEVFLWNRYWWPKHYATAAVYLNSQGTNPASISVKDWLSSKLSSVRSGRKMKAALGK